MSLQRIDINLSTQVLGVRYVLFRKSVAVSILSNSIEQVKAATNPCVLEQVHVINVQNSAVCACEPGYGCFTACPLRCANAKAVTSPAQRPAGPHPLMPTAQVIASQLRQLQKEHNNA